MAAVPRCAACLRSPLQATCQCNAVQDNIICHVTAMLLSISRITPLPMHILLTLFTSFALLSCARRRNRHRHQSLPMLLPLPLPILLCSPSSAAPPPRYSFPSNPGILAAVRNAMQSLQGDHPLASTNSSSCRSLTLYQSNASHVLLFPVFPALSCPQQRAVLRNHYRHLPACPRRARGCLLVACWKFFRVGCMHRRCVAAGAVFAVLFLHVQQH